MPAPNDGSNGSKRPADDMDPEIAVLRAFLENGFPAWVQRIRGDYLTRIVAENSLRCQKQGKYIPTLTEGMATLMIPLWPSLLLWHSPQNLAMPHKGLRRIYPLFIRRSEISGPR